MKIIDKYAFQAQILKKPDMWSGKTASGTKHY